MGKSNNKATGAAGATAGNQKQKARETQPKQPHKSSTLSQQQLNCHQPKSDDSGRRDAPRGDGFRGAPLPLRTRAFWRQLLQWYCVTASIHTLPLTIAASVLAAAWAFLLFLWVLFDFAGVAPAAARMLGLEMGSDLHKWMSTGIDTFMWTFGEYALAGRGDWLVNAVQDAVDPDGGTKRDFFIGMACVYIALVTLYALHVATDRRWRRAATGRTDVLRRTWWFRRGMRGYFPAELYADAATGKHDRGVSFARLDGPEDRETLAAREAALNMLPDRRPVYRGGVVGDGAGETEPARYLFTCHPHGLFTLSVWCTFVAWSTAFGALFDARRFISTVHTLAVNFKFPIWREILLDCRFSDCARSTLLHALGGAAAVHVTPGRNHRRRGRPAPTSAVSSSAATAGTPKSGEQSRYADRPRLSVLVPGGAEESVNCTEAKLTLAKRKGFIRVALTTGAAIVPTYSFGETELYAPVTRHPLVVRMLLKLQKMTGIGTPVVVGRNIINVFTPKRRRLRTVFGKPIDVRRHWRVAPQDDLLQAAGVAPGAVCFTDADVDALHAEYLEALKALYLKYQPRFDPDGAKQLQVA